MRPRGESISFPQRVYVGQVCKQKPQWTHIQKLRVRGIVVIESSCFAVHRHGELLPHMPPTKRPGFKICRGSNCCLFRCISGHASFTVPHTSSSSLIATGHCATVSVPSRRSTSLRRARSTIISGCSAAASKRTSVSPVPCATSVTATLVDSAEDFSAGFAWQKMASQSDPICEGRTQHLQITEIVALTNSFCRSFQDSNSA